MPDSDSVDGLSYCFNAFDMKAIFKASTSSLFYSAKPVKRRT